MLALAFVSLLSGVSIATAQDRPPPQDPRNFPFTWTFASHPISESERNTFFRRAESRQPISALSDLDFTVQVNEPDEVRAFNTILNRREGVFTASELESIGTQLHIADLAAQTQGEPYKIRLGALLQQVVFLTPSLEATKQLVKLFAPYMPVERMKSSIDNSSEFCARIYREAGYKYPGCLSLFPDDLTWVHSLPESPSQASHPCNDPKLRDSYDHEEPNFHQYSTKDLICDKSGHATCTRQAVYALMTSHVGFMAPYNKESVLSANSAAKTPPINNCQPVDLFGLETSNPIKVELEPTSFTATNYTLPGHIFANPDGTEGGFVRRGVVDDSVAVYIVTLGEGIGPNRELNLFMGPALWEEIDANISHYFSEHT